MFGRQGGIGGGNTSNSSNLVEFRAGRMNMIGKMVHPDARKGMVYLTQSEDGLMHFCWKDRATGKVEDDLIVFPDDFEFKRVEQCKTGRVYVLKFKSSSRRMFFWMQEPKTEKDEELCRRVNELMNNPPSQQRNNSDNGDLQYMLNNMSQQQLMQLFGGVGQMGGLTSLLGSMNRTENSSRTPARNANNAGASNLLTPESNTAPKTPSAPKGKDNNKSSAGATTYNITESSAPSTRTLNVDLSTAINGSEAINEIISDPERAKLLSVHLPESEDADENKKQQIKDTIASPQFQQALSLFSNALQSAQLGPVVSQFELTPDAVAAAYAGNLEDFVKALEKALPSGANMDTTKARESEKDKEPMQKEEGEGNSPDKKE
ncbi:PREDICTED: proteasomal ubiquitin receptor ADRM1 homolog [Rhagoletis zephyria]|uniref:proteasomal ubiquitin receptor ADRM1 homolog n=1 Tax=Rhagoletis zephyria TaxID=28612 RepID=UPI0008119B7C|nr:PREDICTED: proteasomal ubiquitin receptor ADRM1 homolog [Rhagoletis zephyria]XP_017477699.1 PREDICTED: proteasomal ubiquitin receptor ADRM1 homolog [Rhagoletis zephyria]